MQFNQENTAVIITLMLKIKEKKLENNSDTLHYCKQIWESVDTVAQRVEKLIKFVFRSICILTFWLTTVLTWTSTTATGEQEIRKTGYIHLKHVTKVFLIETSRGDAPPEQDQSSNIYLRR